MNKKHSKTRPLVSETDVLTTEHEAVTEARQELIDEIKETADKLSRDGATTGDLKILSRALRELRYAFKVFTPYRQHRKVTVFGSARTKDVEPDFVQAEEFGRQMAEEEWMVLTGAGGGIMEAAHRGCGRELAMGVNILLPFEQDANPIINNDPKLVHLKYFFTRKLIFVKEVHAVALFAGGFGTQDEAFETLTLVQTGKRDLMPIVLVDAPDGDYWKGWEEFIKSKLLDKNLISPEDMSLYYRTNDVEDAVEEILNFYSVYNSMRFIKDQLVLRLHVEPPAEFIEKLNDNFSDILLSGKIERVPTHRFEADDAHLADLPRLGFKFNRRFIGRLRQMVDFINEGLGPLIEDDE
ncbi:LOG family protein YgdH [Polystyrenella longa]|uniref:AMP nucleosidase n=1 Tax=Polystyrenella longa TaxID=2528007 RepID=A0A518CQC5_9PLAN|nr:LOG family protein [Polystyrenella longa]QDU81404.1 LOG family protein YgdH [Polystyrenella longa]